MAHATGDGVGRCHATDSNPAEAALEHLLDLDADALDHLPDYEPPSILDLLKKHDD